MSPGFPPLEPPRERGFWLFKSEPGAFSLDDLRTRPGATEGWDGVRNYQARNFLRDRVAVGDLVLFYHSGIPRPAVVGTAEVVRAGYPDPTALDPHHPHFDPRATPDNPIWYQVDVRFRSAFPRPVTLDEIRRVPELAGMPLVNRSRLSIQPVGPTEWDLILMLAAAPPAP